MVVGVADAVPPSPGAVGADPEHLAQPVRLRGDDGGRLVVAGRGQDGRPRLGPAGQDPRQPRQAGPDRPAPRGIGAELEHRPGVGLRDGRGRRRDRHAGGQARVRAGRSRMDRPRRACGSSTGSSLRDASPATTAPTTAGPGDDHERPAPLGHEGVEPGPDLGRGVGRGDVADHDGVEAGQRVGGAVGTGGEGGRVGERHHVARPSAGGRRPRRARPGGRAPARCGGSGTPTAPRRRPAGPAPCRRRPGRSPCGGRCRRRASPSSGSIATVRGTGPVLSIGTRKATTGREPSAGAGRPAAAARRRGVRAPRRPRGRRSRRA